MDELLEKLRSVDVDAQYDALRQLRDARRADGISVALALLDSPEWNVRDAAAEYLRYVAPPGDVTIGRRLMVALFRAADSKIVDTDDEDSDAIAINLERNTIVEALGLMEYTPACDVLQTIARTDSDSLWIARHSALESLERMRCVEAFDVFVEALELDEQDEVRSQAAWAILVVAQPQHFAEIARLIKSQHDAPRVLISLLLAAYKLGQKGAFPQLLRLLETIENASDALGCLSVLDWAYQGQQMPQTVADIPDLMLSLNILASHFPHTEITCEEMRQELEKIIDAKEEEREIVSEPLDRQLVRGSTEDLLDMLARILAGEVIPPDGTTGIR